ncbi:chorismate mutase [Pseudomonas sp. efr-133-TYG-103a]|uniref:chorismate mutase n=1 Tax=Pseudomonas sp. efr-133-TYG-103a TaxID=3040308 RepID=UPI0025560F8B|nr:chorismate mutase [Pseudomonas sp. efr-133-TYG-103a]
MNIPAITHPFKPWLPYALAGLALTVFNASAASTVPGADGPGHEALKPLLAAINERIEIADQVALTKWDSAQPVQDAQREAKVIADARQQAGGYKLAADEAAQLLAAQIEANKLVQYGLLAAWHTAGKAPETPRPDLKNDIRPQLDTLQNRLLRSYATFSPFRTSEACPGWLSQTLPGLAKDELHKLALIRATGELCIRHASLAAPQS